MKNSIFIFISILLLSCSGDRKNLRNSSLIFKEVETFKIKDSSLVLNYGFLTHYFQDNDSQYLIGLNNYFNKLEIIDLCTNSTLTAIDFNQIDHFVINNFQGEEFSLISKDSIYIYSPENQKLALLNYLGKLRNFIDLGAPIYTFQSENFLEPLPVSTRSFFSNKKLLYFRSVPPYDWYNDVEFYKKPFIVSFDLSSRTFHSTFGNFSNSISESSKFLPVDYQNAFYLNFQKNNYVISERRDHFLYEHSLKTNLLTNKTYAKSNFLNDFELQDRKLEMQTMRNSFIKNGDYINILYNPFKRQYYRVVTHDQELINPNNGKLNHPINNRPFSIIVMNERFEVIGESLFENVPFNYMNLVPHSDGILTFYKDKDNEDINHFVVFDFEF